MTDNRKRAVALGFFDGLHVAHMQVLQLALSQKQNGLVPAILIFDEHPQTVLTGKRVNRLMTAERRDKMLTDMGFEIHKMSFADIKDDSPAEFTNKILQQHFHAGFVCCGYNYRFGKNGAGDAKLLKELCADRGISVEVCRQVQINGITVCSTAIRKAAVEGDIETVNLMLGRPLEFCTGVFHGDERGRLLGSPTANQYLPENFIIPKFGVYASVVDIEGVLYPGVTNIGIRPTFQGDSLRSETYIIGFSGDLYGRFIDVKLYAFIREEKTFPSFDALKAQIAVDAENAEKIIHEKLKNA